MFYFKSVSVLLLCYATAVLSTDDCDQTCCAKNWLGYNGFCYRYFALPKSWADAHTYCQDLEADLASIHSADENNIINGLIGGQRAWIGLSDQITEGQFVWTDETSFFFSKWGPNQPDNDNGHEDCVHLGYPESGLWNDQSCTSEFGFVCKI
nr:C-type lectin [Ophioplocus japonicus]